MADSLQKQAADVDKRQEIDPGATAVIPPGPIEPGQGVDPVAREVPPPNIGGAEGRELHDALSALEARMGGLITYHASVPVLTDDGLAELKGLLDRVVKAHKGVERAG